MCVRHIGLRPCLVDEDRAPWMEAQLDFLPQGAASRDVRAVLLTGEERLKLTPSRRRKRHSLSQNTATPRSRNSERSACNVRSGFSARRPSRHLAGIGKEPPTV